MNIHKLHNTDTTDNITITLTRDQYKALLKTVYLGEWVVNSPHFSEEELDTDIVDIEQQIYSYAALAGKTDWIEFDETGRIFIPTVEMEAELFDDIDEYDIQNFWDYLVDNLATRDLIERFGEEKVDSMTVEEYAKYHFELVKDYDAEFAKHNLDRLRIVKQ